MNVLSLFDGMSCGQLALSKLGIPIDNYFASEVDKPAIEVTRRNFPNTKHLGDVRKINGGTLPRIDLLIGGSPCQGFSYLGEGLNFEDPRSALFFEYVRLKGETNPDFFLLENVRMKQEFQEIISNALGVKPILINSNLLSGQNRPRLYWTNLPVEQPEDLGVSCQSVIDPDDITPTGGKFPEYWKAKGEYYLSKDMNRILQDNHKACCMTARSVSNWKGNLVRVPGGLRFISPVEAERLQTVPDGYTSGASKTQRHRMLGNGWTVDVVAHILKPLVMLS